MIVANEPPQDTPDWRLPSRDYLAPKEWAGIEDDPENVVRGEN